MFIGTGHHTVAEIEECNFEADAHAFCAVSLAFRNTDVSLVPCVAGTEHRTVKCYFFV